MQLHRGKNFQGMRWWRQHFVQAHIQSANFHVSSWHHQPPKPVHRPRPRHFPRDLPPPARSLKTKEIRPKEPQVRQTDASISTRAISRGHSWATKLKKVVRGFFVISCGAILFLYITSQDVPITGRTRLSYVPNWVARLWEDSILKRDNALRKDIAHSSLGKDDPEMQGLLSVFNRLVRASGLDDRDWDLRVVRAPGQ